jgi:hypothetical protein
MLVVGEQGCPGQKFPVSLKLLVCKKRTNFLENSDYCAKPIVFHISTNHAINL